MFLVHVVLRERISKLALQELVLYNLYSRLYLKSDVLVVKVLSLEAANEAGVFLDFLSIVLFRPEEK